MRPYPTYPHLASLSSRHLPSAMSATSAQPQSLRRAGNGTHLCSPECPLTGATTRHRVGRSQHPVPRLSSPIFAFSDQRPAHTLSPSSVQTHRTDLNVDHLPQYFVDIPPLSDWRYRVFPVGAPSCPHHAIRTTRLSVGNHTETRRSSTVIVLEYSDVYGRSLWVMLRCCVELVVREEILGRVAIGDALGGRNVVDAWDALVNFGTALSP